MIRKNYCSLFLILSMFLLAHCQKAGDGRSYRVNGSMTVDGRTRTYLLNLPPAYYDSSGFSLVIGLHGAGGSAAQFERDYKFSDKANASGFIAVYPEGVQSTGVLHLRTWNAGTCCDFARDNNIDDVKFISQLIDNLLANYKINPKRVYVTGMSNGGMLAYRLACEIPGKIAAIGVNSCTMVVTQPCNPSRPMPVLHIHSAVDTKVPPAGGFGMMGYYFPPVDSVLQVWSAINTCGEPPVSAPESGGYTFTKWSPCSNGSTIEYYLTSDGGHAWPGGLQSGRRGDIPSTELNADDLIWAFFQRYELP